MLTIIGAKVTNRRKLEKAIVQAFEQWAEKDINEDHWRYQFLEREWPYAGTTQRENKKKYPEPVGNPRNIEDWGDLYESGKYKFSEGPNRADAYWHWGATNSSGQEYAYYVHYGKGTNKSARPFTDDISIPSSFWEKEPGQALKMQMETAFAKLNV